MAPIKSLIAMSRRARLIAIVCAAAILLSAAENISIRPGEPSYASRIGFYYRCLAVRNHELRPGTPVTIIRFNSGDELFVDGRTHDRRVAATILGKTDSTEQCPTLTAERTGEAEIDDVSHYTVSPVVNGSLDSVEFGIAIVGLGPGNADPIDLDGDGTVDTFSVFVTLDGLIFELWKGERWVGEPLWTALYHYDHGPEE
jgi:hypothetical protein